MLDSLPQELLDNVLRYASASVLKLIVILNMKQIHKKDHLLQVSSVSRRLRPLVFARLFRVIIVNSTDENDPQVFRDRPYFAVSKITNPFHQQILPAIRHINLNSLVGPGDSDISPYLAKTRVPSPCIRRVRLGDYADEYYDRALRDTVHEQDFFQKLVEIITQSKFECLGICDKPSDLLGFGGFPTKGAPLKLLHLRFAGKPPPMAKSIDEDEFDDDTIDEYIRAQDQEESEENEQPELWEFGHGLEWREKEEKEVEDFADWAFGPLGFPKLEVLALGDFSHNGRFADSQGLWCRVNDDPPCRQWKPVTPQDVKENELIEANMDMLSACPVSPLFWASAHPQVFPGWM
ncbi:uncharacterized protein KY384_000899 [Bacidia gigantensis]|uniref:uncharacterized protein n=1 Tax=Bacidia gigantensis TaxID=2732470 RepID=UPI001D0519A9|nr:uncharacterized protein KY384_000899 [Bacidia gigantensis]KAG8534056.1 hypothetical protein KY384_000899 [Bacidia gigantensis]